MRTSPAIWWLVVNIYNNNSDTADVNGHGTNVAGAAGARSNNSLEVASVLLELQDHACADFRFHRSLQLIPALQAA